MLFFCTIMVYFFSINYVMSNGGQAGGCTCVTKGQFHHLFTCSFYVHRSQKCKKSLADSLIVFFALLVSSKVKAASKMLLKLTPNLKIDQVLFELTLSLSAFPVSTIQIVWSLRIAMIFSTRQDLLNHTVICTAIQATLIF